MKILSEILGEDPGLNFLPKHFTRLPFSRPAGALPFQHLLSWDVVKKLIDSRNSVLRIVKDGVMIRDYVENLSFEEARSFHDKGHTLLLRFIRPLNYHRRSFVIQLFLSAFLLLSCTHHHHSKNGLHQHTGKHVPGHINDMYLDPKLNAREKNDDFESWDRDVNTFRAEIVDALPIKTGDAIADVGAGTGIFERLLSHKTGPGGKVYAIDIAPSFIPFMKNRFEQEKLKNVEVILGRLDTTTLKDTSVNLVLVIDTYHHFDDAIVMLKDFQRILRPGGHLVIVDFKKTQTAREWIKNHISKTKEDYVKEITAEHFEFLQEENIPFKESFQLTFRKKAK